jgi:hypothetical protein
MIVELEWYEWQAAAEVGIRRKSESIRHGHKDKYGVNFTPITDPGWQVISACSEAAVCKGLNIYYDSSVNTFERADVLLKDHKIEIKSQLHHLIDDKKHQNYLVARPNYDSDTKYLLVLVHSLTRYELCGFMTGLECKQDKWLGAVYGRPAIFRVPLDVLHDVRILMT